MSAQNTVHTQSAFLDDFRLKNGMHQLRGAFHEIANSDTEKAVQLINDGKLQYPSLFILQPELKKHDLHTRLNNRNSFSLELTNRLLENTMNYPYEPAADHYPHLKWMLDSGAATDGLNDSYDEVLDNVAVLLAKAYQDKPCLNTMENIIFSRHRKGFYIYDLVWAYFECCGPDNLLSLANRLRSPYTKDVELARQLLNFIPCVGNPGREHSAEAQYSCAVKYLQRNRGNLYYTGQTNQQRSNPVRFAVGSSTGMRQGDRHD